MPKRVNGHEVIFDREVERVPRSREPHLAHWLALDLIPYLGGRRHPGEEVERVGEFIVEERRRRETVRSPPGGGGLGLARRCVGELDPKGQCLARSLTSTSSAGTPVPGTCVRIDSARNP